MRVGSIKESVWPVFTFIMWPLLHMLCHMILLSLVSYCPPEGHHWVHRRQLQGLRKLWSKHVSLLYKAPSLQPRVFLMGTWTRLRHTYMIRVLFDLNSPGKQDGASNYCCTLQAREDKAACFSFFHKDPNLVFKTFFFLRLSCLGVYEWGQGGDTNIQMTATPIINTNLTWKQAFVCEASVLGFKHQPLCFLFTSWMYTAHRHSHTHPPLS